MTGQFSTSEAHPDHFGTEVTVGEFAGWRVLPSEPFDNHVGPFFHRPRQGGAECVFRSDSRHANGLGLLHGGCLLTLADYCLFIGSAYEIGSTNIVTISVNSEFMNAVRTGDLIEGHAEVIKAGASIIFARGMLRAGTVPILNFSGSLKRLRRPVS
jgi:uncharacterized protein (TIGR00369 family)